MDYLRAAGLVEPLEALGFHLAGFGCMTCIGASGPLIEEVAAAVRDDDLTVVSVLSGNRNFEGRIHPEVKLNYLASPPLVVAYALAGTMDLDLRNDPLGHDPEGRAVFLADLWPSAREVEQIVERSVDPDMFRRAYAGDLRRRPSLAGARRPDRQHLRLGPGLDLRAPPAPPGPHAGPAAPGPGHRRGARRLRQRSAPQPARPGDRRRRHPLLRRRRRGDADVPGGPDLPGARHPGRGHRRQGLRRRVLPRLGGQGPQAAWCPGHPGRVLRAHPPLQPHRHGHPPLAVPPRGVGQVVGSDRCGDHRHPRAGVRRGRPHPTPARGPRRRNHLPGARGSTPAARPTTTATAACCPMFSAALRGERGDGCPG
jgi:hypothetical protein